MSDLAYRAKVFLALTTVLVYVTTEGFAVAIGFVDSACSGLCDSRGFMVCFR